MLMENEGLKAKIYPFAAPLKIAAKSLVEQVSPKGPYGKEEIVLGESATFRDVLVGLGQLMRTFDADFWVKCAKRKIEQDSDFPEICIFDDMRFPNELNFIKKEGSRQGNNYLLVYLRDVNYIGTAQNEAEGQLKSSDCDITVFRRIVENDVSEGVKNAEFIYGVINNRYFKERHNIWQEL